MSIVYYYNFSVTYVKKQNFQNSGIFSQMEISL